MDKVLTDEDLDAVTGAVSSEWCFSLGRIEGKDILVCFPKDPPPPPPPPPPR
jgi:hypothetical protein